MNRYLVETFALRLSDKPEDVGRSSVNGLGNPGVEASRLNGLKDCFKIKLRRAGYRPVYQVKDEVLLVSVVAVGKREREAVYKQAVRSIRPGPPCPPSDQLCPHLPQRPARYIGEAGAGAHVVTVSLLGGWHLHINGYQFAQGLQCVPVNSFPAV